MPVETAKNCNQLSVVATQCTLSYLFSLFFCFVYLFSFFRTNHAERGQDGRCFLAAWAVSKSVHCCLNDRPKPNLPKR